MRLSWVPVLSLPSENVLAPPFAELNVRLRVEFSAGAESIDGGFAAQRILSALKNYRPCTGTGKHQRREHPGRAEADDDGREAASTCGMS